MQNKLLKAIPAILAVFLMLGVFTAPVLADNTGSISNTLQTQNLAPTIISMTPQSQDLSGNPGNTVTATVTAVMYSPNGVGQLRIPNVDYELHGDTNNIMAATVSGPTPINSTSESFVFTCSFSKDATPGLYDVRTYAMTKDGLNSDRGIVTINLLPTLGITVNTPTLDFGKLAYDQTSATQVASVTSTSNVNLNVGVTPGAWTSSDSAASSMDASVLHYSAFATAAPGSTVTSNMQVVVPAASESFIMSGNYASTTTVVGSAA
jgi:hypothetical protein